MTNNEQDFRPLGSRETGMPGLAGAARETTFDVEAFSADRPDALHMIPVGDKSRVWICDVREWRRRQTQTSREANKQAEVSRTKTKAGGSSAPSSDKQFERAQARIPSGRASRPAGTRRDRTGP